MHINEDIINKMLADPLYDICEYDDYIRDPEHIFKTDDRCIGSVAYPDKDGIFLLDLHVDPRLFYKYENSLVLDFLQLPIHPEHRIFGGIEIVQIKVIDDAYTVIIKTFWIRIVQRRWKRYMKERNMWIQKMKRNVLKIIGCRVHPLNEMPAYKGILSSLVYEK
jgi:hypothetical protein